MDVGIVVLEWGFYGDVKECLVLYGVSEIGLPGGRKKEEGTNDAEHCNTATLQTENGKCENAKMRTLKMQNEVYSTHSLTICVGHNSDIDFVVLEDNR